VSFRGRRAAQASVTAQAPWDTSDGAKAKPQRAVPLWRYLVICVCGPVLIAGTLVCGFILSQTNANASNTADASSFDYHPPFKNAVVSANFIQDNAFGGVTSESPSCFVATDQLSYYGSLDQSFDNSPLMQSGCSQLDDYDSFITQDNHEQSIQRASEPVLTLSDDDATTVYYLDMCSDPDQATRRSGVNLTGYIFDNNNGQYSNVRYITRDPTQWSEATFGPSYDESDKVAESIIYEATEYKVFSRCNNGQATYVGFSDNPDVNQLSIGGVAPTKVVSANVDGKTYYVWYYSGTDFRQILLNDKDFSFTSSTYAQVEQILQISFGDGS
jgi:hypothetical protein